MTTFTRLFHSPQALRIAVAFVFAACILLFARMPEASSFHMAALTTEDTAIFPDQSAFQDLPELPAIDPQNSLILDQDDARLSNARFPITDTNPQFARPFIFSGSAEDRLRARDCLAAAAWYEAGDDPSGARAVIQVILNRTRHPAFPDSICGVVFQGSNRKTGCQFTFTCDGALARRPSIGALNRARAVADAALSGSIDAPIGLATHYHADYVVPYWRDEMTKISQRGAHIFYRWSGHWGSLAAMRKGYGHSQEAAQPALAFMSSMHETLNPTSMEEVQLPAVQMPVPVSIHTTPAQVTTKPALEMQLDLSAPSGSYALKALSLCGTTPDCRVAGKVDSELAFIYIRKRNGGAEGTYWDCSRFQRKDNAQCMPNGAVLAHLLMTS